MLYAEYFHFSVSLILVYDLVPSSGLAFFSDAKVDSLVQRTNNNELRYLIDAIDTTLQTNLLKRADAEFSKLYLSRSQCQEFLLPEEAPIFLKRWFGI